MCIVSVIINISTVSFLKCAFCTKSNWNVKVGFYRDLFLDVLIQTRQNIYLL